MIRATLLLCCLIVSTTSWSQNITVYKCVINGVPTFAQLPCAKDAQTITLKDINVTSAYSNIPKNDDITDTSVDEYLKIQQIERDIKQHQLDIEQYKKSFAEKKQQIGYMTQDKANRLGAASIADAIATKTATLKKTYDALINQKQQQIDALNKQKQQLKVKP